MSRRNGQTAIVRCSVTAAVFLIAAQVHAPLTLLSIRSHRSQSGEVAHNSGTFRLPGRAAALRVDEISKSAMKGDMLEEGSAGDPGGVPSLANHLSISALENLQLDLNVADLVASSREYAGFTIESGIQLDFLKAVMGSMVLSMSSEIDLGSVLDVLNGRSIQRASVAINLDLDHGTGDDEFEVALDSGGTTGGITGRARPLTDGCEQAEMIEPGREMPVHRSNINATGTQHSACTSPENPDSADVWFAWRAPCDQLVVATTTDGNTSMNTTLEVRESCGGASVVCNDNYAGSGNGRQSSVEWFAVGGRTYFIRVAGANGSEGTFDLYVGYKSDFNRDGVVNSLDYAEFLAAFGAGGIAADFNSDNSIDLLDYLEFDTAFQCAQ